MMDHSAGDAAEKYLAAKVVSVGPDNDQGAAFLFRNARDLNLRQSWHRLHSRGKPLRFEALLVLAERSFDILLNMLGEGDHLANVKAVHQHALASSEGSEPSRTIDYGQGSRR